MAWEAEMDRIAGRGTTIVVRPEEGGQVLWVVMILDRRVEV